MNLLTAPAVLGSFEYEAITRQLDVRLYEPARPARVMGVEVTVQKIDHGCWLVRDEYGEPVAVYQSSYAHWAIVMFTYAGPAAESVLFSNGLDHGPFEADASRRVPGERPVAVFHDGMRPRPMRLVRSDDFVWGYVVGIVPAEYLEAPQPVRLVPPLCIHGMLGCATCAGTDDLRPAPRQGPTRYQTPWTDEEDAVARDRSLSSREVAERLGRTVSAVSAHRLGVLRMKGGWPGYVAKPARSRRRSA